MCLLAGGRGSRLGSLTESVPKPLLRVGGRPFIEWPLLQLRHAGFMKVVLAIGYQGHQIRDHIGDGRCLGIDVTYVEDGPAPLGTLGAVRAALGFLSDQVPVMYADTILQMDFAGVVEEHARAGYAGMMSVLRNDNRDDASNAVVSGDRVKAYGKAPVPSGAAWIDYGFLVIARKVLAESSGADLAPLLASLAASRDLGAYVVSEPFHEVGTPASLAATDAWLRHRGAHALGLAVECDAE